MEALPPAKTVICEENTSLFQKQLSLEASRAQKLVKSQHTKSVVVKREQQEEEPEIRAPDSPYYDLDQKRWVNEPVIKSSPADIPISSTPTARVRKQPKKKRSRNGRKRVTKIKIEPMADQTIAIDVFGYDEDDNESESKPVVPLLDESTRKRAHPSSVSAVLPSPPIGSHLNLLWTGSYDDADDDEPPANQSGSSSNTVELMKTEPFYSPVPTTTEEQEAIVDTKMAVDIPSFHSFDFQSEWPEATEKQEEVVVEKEKKPEYPVKIKSERPHKKARAEEYATLMSAMNEKFERLEKLRQAEADLFTEKLRLQQMEHDEKMKSLEARLLEITGTAQQQQHKQEQRDQTIGVKKTDELTVREALAALSFASETCDDKSSNGKRDSPSKKKATRNDRKKPIKLAKPPTAARQGKLSFTVIDDTTSTMRSKTSLAETEHEAVQSSSDESVPAASEEQIAAERAEQARLEQETDEAAHAELAIAHGYNNGVRQGNHMFRRTHRYKMTTLLSKLQKPSAKLTVKNAMIKNDDEEDDDEEEEEEEEEVIDKSSNDSTDQMTRALANPILQQDYRILMHMNVSQVQQPTGEMNFGFQKSDDPAQLPLLISMDGPILASPKQLADQATTPLSVVNRLNTSNLLLHTWFANKSQQHNTSEKVTHRIEVIKQRAYSYDPVIVHNWFPYLTAGDNTILVENLECNAVSLQKGQGLGKCCPFCGMQFVSCKAGTIKYSHHLELCDTLANISNDERVVLETVLQKCVQSNDFANHAFIRTRTPKSLMRFATPAEVDAGLFVECPRTAQKLRLNIEVFIEMRRKTYDFFLTRIRTLDLATDEKNLGAGPLTGLLDCFDLNRRVTTPLSKSKKPKKYIRFEDGFLYRTLLDHDGNQFMATKTVGKHNKPLRDFTIDPATGFGDSMYFSMAGQQALLPMLPAFGMPMMPIMPMMAFDFASFCNSSGVGSNNNTTDNNNNSRNETNGPSTAFPDFGFGTMPMQFAMPPQQPHDMQQLMRMQYEQFNSTLVNQENSSNASPVHESMDSGSNLCSGKQEMDEEPVKQQQDGEFAPQQQQHASLGMDYQWPVLNSQQYTYPFAEITQSWTAQTKTEEDIFHRDTEDYYMQEDHNNPFNQEESNEFYMPGQDFFNPNNGHF